ncbi:MAG: hypothetical protein HFH72_08460 [Lachnospiraceae bacterium]|nr:hypothetical protein [Lachnospiraceae bacterium]
MRWTDMSEKEIIKAWAAEEYTEGIREEYLPQPDACRGSYWTDFDNGGNIVEYDFGTVPEFKGMLEKEFQEGFFKELILPLAVAAFKEREIIQLDAGRPDNEQDVKKNTDGFSIPEFVYVF